jgi:hypothetical protein
MTSLAVVAPRVGQLIRLLGSDRDGEVVAAARALGRTLAGAGQDFHDLAACVESPAAAQTARRANTNDWRTSARWLINSGAGLTPKERAFVHQMASWPYEPSERQSRWLEALIERASLRRESA